MLIFQDSCDFSAVRHTADENGSADGNAEKGSASVGYALDSGCLVTKYESENGTAFEYPVASECIFDENGALTAIEDYCAEMYIPIAFTYVDAAKLTKLKKRYARYDIKPCKDALSDGLSVFRPLSEIFGRDSFPSVSSDLFEMSPLSQRDAEDYDRLCRDDGVNKYWGYDYRADCPFPAPDFFISDAKRDLKNGLSLSLAIRCGGEFAGESILHGFNCRGSANAGIRLFEKYRGKGIGSKAFSALLDCAFSEIGLTEVHAKCMKQNTASYKMLSKCMTFLTGDASFYYFNAVRK